MNTPTENEIKRTIHVRLGAILDRAKHERSEAKLKWVQAEAVLKEIDDDPDNFGPSFGAMHLKAETAKEEWKNTQSLVEYWKTVLDWADEKLIGPLTEEAKRN